MLADLLAALVGGLLFVALWWGLPLGAATLWVIYGMPVVLTWWLGPLHARPVLAALAWRDGGCFSGALVFSSTQALIAGRWWLLVPAFRFHPTRPSKNELSPAAI